MLDKKLDKAKQDVKPKDDVELEYQFILRLPEEPAKLLHEALQNGNLKDRMSIKLDNDLRYGEVRLDNWLLHSKLVDLPTIIECLKTIDNKSFYKSADICQLMICKEEADALDTEKESPNKNKKKDPNKVDKKYLWPHGITPPCKNVRKRRFRKTLKKKNVEAPEIEKEVKRLLRIDNDAIKVDYEIINEELDKGNQDEEQQQSQGDEFNDYDFNDETINDAEGEKVMNENESSSQKDINVESDGDDMPPGPSQTGDVGEHDIFGEELSSSDDDDDNTRHNESTMRDMEDVSRLSADDSRLSEYSLGGTIAAAASAMNAASRDEPTEFSRSMFGSVEDVDDIGQNIPNNSSEEAASGYYESNKQSYDYDYSNEATQLSNEQINLKIQELRRQLDDLKDQQSQKAQEISSIQNPTLRQRMQETLDNLLTQMLEKELEIKDLENML